jgi:hypothetical protein
MVVISRSRRVYCDVMSDDVYGDVYGDAINCFCHGWNEDQIFATENIFLQNG